MRIQGIAFACAAAAVLRAADAPAGAPADRAATEFLERWDGRYRLVDPARHRAPPNYAAAAAELKKAVLAGIPDEELYYRLGFCYEKLGDLDGALDAYGRAAARAEPKGFRGGVGRRIPFRLGLVHARRGSLREAASWFEKAMAAGDDSAAVHNNLGYCLRAMALKRRALESFAAALERDAALAEARLNEGVTRAELGDLAGAEEALRRAAALRPGMPDVDYVLGLVRRARGNPGGARESFRRAVSLFPDDARPRRALARLHLEAGMEEEAAAEAREAVRLEPSIERSDPDLGALARRAPAPAPPDEREAEPPAGRLLSRARRRAASGDLDGARDAYEEIIKEKPDTVAALLELAAIEEGEGRSDRAAELYRRVIDRRPELGPVWFALGMALERAGSYGAAAEALEKAAERLPDSALAAYNLGICYGRLGRRGEAEAQYLLAARLDPGFAEARFGLGAARAARRDFAGAIEEYGAALRINPADADAHYNLAQIYRLHAGRPRDAAEHFRAYLRHRPDAEDAARVEAWIRELAE
ncbi:MAG: tetratricopeptide repeat protein [bacterium]|nr:tetratricopeptide repeat protein [bacterium]